MSEEVTYKGVVHALVKDTGGYDIFHHFKRIAIALWPEKDSKAAVNFIWHPWAERMIRAACDHEYLAIAGSGGCGKSEAYAIWAIVNYLADPENTTTSTKVMASAVKPISFLPSSAAFLRSLPI